VEDSLYDDPSYYRLLFGGRSHDLPFYEQLAQDCTGTILELGVGTGRVAMALARAGHSIVGIDTSEEMLGVLAEQLRAEPSELRTRIAVSCADARTIDLGRRFPLVLFPFNGLAHQRDQAALEQLLANVIRHLEPDGCFAFDVTVPDPALLKGATSTAPWFRHPRTGDVCRCDETASYDPATRVLTCTATIRWMEVEREPQTLRWQLRQFQPEETMRLLEGAGFDVLRQEKSLQDAIGYVCRPAGR
jgi:SAM-dependent methyltransferase